MSARRFEEMLGQFSRWGYDERGWAANTRMQYAGRVRAAEAWLKEHRRVSLPYATPKDLKAYLFSTAPVARSRNNIRQALSGFGAFLVEAGYSEVNSASALPSLPEPRRIPRALPAKVCQRIEQTARTFDPKVRALVLVFLYGGLRRNEARLLEWSDLDLEGGWFRFRGKGDVERAVPMHPAVKDALTFWKIACPDARYVFPGRWGNQPVSLTWISEHIRDVGVAAGIHLHPHLLRHSFATALLNGPAKGNLRTVQTALGHTNIQTTAHYARVWPADLQAAVKELTYSGDREVPDKVRAGHPQEQAHHREGHKEDDETDAGGGA